MLVKIDPVIDEAWNKVKYYSLEKMPEGKVIENLVIPPDPTEKYTEAEVY